jgi:hypothetical protein
LQIGAARLARRRVEANKLLSRAGYLLISNSYKIIQKVLPVTCKQNRLTLAQETFNEISIRTQVIHPSPPVQLREWLQNAIADDIGSIRYMESIESNRQTYNVSTNEKRKLNRIPAI